MTCKRRLTDEEFSAQSQTIEMRRTLEKGRMELEMAPVTEAIERERAKPVPSRPPQGVSLQRYGKLGRSISARDLQIPMDIRNTPDAAYEAVSRVRAYFEGRKRAVV